MERCFAESEIAKNAFVYMAQPLAENMPAFCLSCLGINNKHDFTLVTKGGLILYQNVQSATLQL